MGQDTSDKTSVIYCKHKGKEHGEYAHTSLHLRMEMYCQGMHSLLFFQVRDEELLPQNNIKEAWTTELLRCVTDLGHRFFAHTCPALPSFVARRLFDFVCCHSRSFVHPRPVQQHQQQQ